MAYQAHIDRFFGELGDAVGDLAAGEVNRISLQSIGEFLQEEEEVPAQESMVSSSELVNEVSAALFDEPFRTLLSEW